MARYDRAYGVIDAMHASTACASANRSAAVAASTFGFGAAASAPRLERKSASLATASAVLSGRS